MSKTDCESCQSSSCSSKNKNDNESMDEFIERQALGQVMCKITNKILVLSGKGGVGKSTVSVNLATSLAMEGYKVGLLDADVHGPSIPTMMGLQNVRPAQVNGKITPVESGGVKVVSVGFFIESEESPLIWRGPMKMGVIKQFLKDVAWGELDYLIIDLPPGTGDEPLSVCQLIEDATGAVVVTTPQEVAAADVKKSINFCHQLNLPILGLVENMSGFVCPECKTKTDIFNSGGGAKLAEYFGVELLGELPIEPAVMAACDAGKPFVQSYGATETAKELKNISEKIVAKCKE
jgi:Mrp family chromosome partitioning ATPase